MNKIGKVLLAVLGGVEAIFSIAMPILVAILWTMVTVNNGQFSWVIISAGIVASTFRAIRVGWLNG
jgi:hypothetical protein